LKYPELSIGATTHFATNLILPENKDMFGNSRNCQTAKYPHSKGGYSRQSMGI
jgi:hypothetical protein